MIVVTGASGVIGRAIADHLASPEVLLVTPSHTQMPVESALAVSKAFEQYHEIQVLVCAHGIFGEAARVEDSDPWLWRHALEVNLLGTYNVCRFAIKKMASNGLIVAIAGGGGMLDPLPFISSYGCSKSGIVSLSRTLAAEHPELRVNCIFPGMQDSEIHDRLLAAGPEGNPSYPAIKKMRETGEGAVPIENTLRALDSLLVSGRSGEVLFARQFGA
jgi:3-oxoacyl-[acyl-carrier protein] reductase